MKELPNGDIAFHNAKSIWSLIGGIVLIIAIIIGYYEIPFHKDERWIYIFMAAPFVVMAIMLFKTYFKPDVKLIISTEGVEFVRYKKIFNSKVKLSWDKIANVFYEKREETSRSIYDPAKGVNVSYTVEILLFKTFENKNIVTYEFEIPWMSMEDRQLLCTLLKNHDIVVEELLRKTNNTF